MKKIVLTFGLISGAVSSVLMLATMSFIDQIGFDRGVIVGYTAIVLSFLLVFFGIRSYRENVGGGQISFGRALSVGILIVLISCICYVVMWEIVSRTWMTDFVDRYTSYATEQARASGAPAEEIEEMNRTMSLYKNNILVRAAFTLLEPLPVGILITLISAAVLRKRPKEEPA